MTSYRKEGGLMSEKEKQIMDTIGEVLPRLTDVEKEKLLSFGEGMAFMKGCGEAGSGKGGDER